MGRIFKYLNKLIKNNPIISIRKIVNRLPFKLKSKFLRFPSEKEIFKEIYRVKKDNKGKSFYIFPSPSCPWGYMFQRPQQLARALAKKGHIVFYMVDTSFPYAPDWHVRGICEIENNIFLVNDNCEGKILTNALSNEKVFIWQYWPHQLKTIKKWDKSNNRVCIYDCIDHIETFLSYDEIDEDFLTSVEKSDIVLATAKSIHQELQVYRKDCLYIPNGVTIEDFIKFKTYPWKRLDEIRESSEVIIGYYGAIADWFDFETIEYIAKHNPKWKLLIVGETYDSVKDKIIKLKQYKNIEVLGRVEYKYIPQLLSCFDVAILPFLINNITLNTSPVKIFEYLAGGKPVVSTKLPEVIDIEGILIADDAIEFNKKISYALSKRNNEGFSEKMIAIAKQNTWEQRIETVFENFKEGNSYKYE